MRADLHALIVRLRFRAECRAAEALADGKHGKEWTVDTFIEWQAADALTALSVAAEPEPVAKIIAARKAIYRHKQSEQDIAAPDTLTRWELYQHTIEALEILEREIAASPSNGESQSEAPIPTSGRGT